MLNDMNKNMFKNGWFCNASEGHKVHAFIFSFLQQAANPPFIFLYAPKRSKV